MRVFDARHPNWSGPVHLFEDGTMCRPGRGAGRYDLEPGRLVLRWNYWGAETLDWVAEESAYVGKEGGGVLREREVDEPVTAGSTVTMRLIVGILACADERFASRRERCLRTWIPPLNRLGVTVLFLVGDPELDEPRLSTPAEHGRLGLELQLPCPDDYPSLPQKTRGFVRWALDSCEFARLFKCDDDTYLVPQRLLRLVQSGPGDYVGHRLAGHVPYASGGAGYLLSRRAAEVVGGRLVAERGCEDVLVGQALATSGIAVTHDARLVPFGNDERRPTPTNDLVTSHAFTRMFDLHRATWGGSPDDFDGIAPGAAIDSNHSQSDPGTTIADHGYWIGEVDHTLDAPLADALGELFSGSNVLDLGCGSGRYVARLRERGIESVGYDGNPYVDRLSHGLCGRADLAERCDFEVRDWVLSLEVGEHVPAEFERTFVDNLHRHNRRGIVVSWAVPGQGGVGHVNERANEDVRAMIEPLGYEFDGESTRWLRERSTKGWFRGSLLVFRKAER